MGTIAEQLLEDYNEYRRGTGHAQTLKQQGRFASRVSRKHLHQFEALAQWCSSHRVEPRRWLASLFESRRWLFPPKLTQLQSEKHLQRYAKMDSIPVYRDKIHREHQTDARQSGRIFEPARDLSNSAEMLKRRYAATGNFDRCLQSMGETFGFHPKSLACSTCPVRQKCLATLQSQVDFDILALREGKITFEQATMAAYYAGR